MIHALGFSQTDFTPSDPGRLCRGRERWIEPMEFDEPAAPIQRLVVSGAIFSDDSASDALRGLPHSKVDLPTVLTSLYPRQPMLAFMEDGHPADIPPDADGIELYDGHRAGGRTSMGLVRWFLRITRHGDNRKADFTELLGTDPMADRVRGFAVLSSIDDDTPELRQDLFFLVGMSTLDSPPARYQPAAFPELLDRVKAIVLVHRDKHGPAVGVYSRDPVKIDGKFEALCETSGALLVRFAIPPMLARWDRALSELRQEWEETRPDDPFPVPRGADSGWEARRRRRRRGKDKKTDDKKAQEAEAVDTEAAEPVEPVEPVEAAEPVDVEAAEVEAVAAVEVPEPEADDEGEPVKE